MIVVSSRSPAEAPGIGEDQAGTAAGQGVGQLGSGRARVERHADRGGPGNRQRALDGFDADADAEQDRHSVAVPHACLRQVISDPRSTPVEIRVGKLPARLRECDLATADSLTPD
jgi:hypothetical protein